MGVAIVAGAIVYGGVFLMWFAWWLAEYHVALTCRARWDRTRSTTETEKEQERIHWCAQMILLSPLWIIGAIGYAVAGLRRAPKAIAPGIAQLWRDATRREH